MANLRLVLPNLSHKDAVLDYKQEFLDNHESMEGTASLKNFSTFESWYEAVQNNLCEATLQEGRVPDTPFLAFSNFSNHLVGIIDIRHRLNEYLALYGGHIGYSVRKSERQKGYAGEMLSLALIEAKKIGLSKVLITCCKDNIASARTIQKNQGILESELSLDHLTFQRYWIFLSS